MLRVLLKFLFLTRFTKPMLIGIGLFLVYAVLMGMLVSEPNPIWGYYCVAILTFFLAMMIAFGGVAIMKSDLDYLFTLPLKRSELAVSFYITQFFATGITFLFAFGYVLPYLSHSTVEIAIVGVNIFLIALMITAFSVLSFRLSVVSKLALAIAMVLWTVSPVLGFQYSYTSIFFGNLFIGTAFTIAINIPVNYLALRELGSIELGFTKVSIKLSGDIYKNQIDYSRHSARTSIYLYNLMQFNLTSRMNIGASTSQKSARIKLHYLLIPMSIFAIIYAFMTIFYDTGEPPNVTIMIVSIYLGMFIPILFSQGVLSYERAWLAFTSMPAYLYWRRVIFSKFIQMLVMVSPFFVASLYLYFMGIQEAINTLPLYILTIPSISILVMYLSGLLTMDQIKEIGIMSSQFSLRQLIVVLPVGLSFAVVIASLISFSLALLSAVFLFGFMLVVVMRKKSWTNLVYKLTERGYV